MRGTVRAGTHRPEIPAAVDLRATGDIGEGIEWRPLLQDVNAVLHLAGHAASPDPEAAETCRRVNTIATLELAAAAAAVGVRRLVYVSTIKVNGEESGPAPFTEATKPHPADAYARSKWEAEQGLHELAAKTGMEVVVVRPPLIYGPGVGGNFFRLLRAIDRGVPLPFGSASNCRSLMFVDNLADLLLRCIESPAAAGQLFLASDGEDLTVRELVVVLAQALDRTPRLLPFPPRVARVGARLLGSEDTARRLFGWLLVDSRKARGMLGWKPPSASRDALAATARWFHEAGSAPRNRRPISGHEG